MNNGRAIATAMSAFSHDSPPLRAKPTVRDPGEHRLHHGQLHSHGVTQGDDRYHPERRCQKGQCGRNDVAVLGSFSASQCSAALLSTNDLFVPLPNLAVFVFAMEICLSHRQHAPSALAQQYPAGYVWLWPALFTSTEEILWEGRASVVLAAKEAAQSLLVDRGDGRQQNVGRADLGALAVERAWPEVLLHLGQHRTSTLSTFQLSGG